MSLEYNDKYLLVQYTCVFKYYPFRAFSVIFKILITPFIIFFEHV